MTIRPANRKDSKKIHEFICELEKTKFNYDLFKKQYVSNLADKDNIYLVAVNKTGHVIGYVGCHGQVLLHHASKVFEIQELFVEKEYRNKKVGQLLIEVLEKNLKNSNYHFLEVTTNRKRVNTLRFYNKCGFTKTHYKFTKTL